MPERFVRASDKSRAPAAPAASASFGQYLDSTIVRKRSRRHDHAVHGERDWNGE
jgi:hypothetical protein